MVKFEVKATQLPKEDGTMSYADLLLLCMKSVPAGGFTIGEMSDRLGVVTKLKETKEGDVVEFEDGQLPGIKQCVSAMRWSILDEQIKDFGDYVMAL